MSITMYDSIEISEIPTSAQAVAGYTSGKWPTYKTLVTKFPKAHHVSIAVNASHDADCLDIEAGDATNADASAWFARQKARKVARPILYTSLSNVNALVAELERHGIHRGQYRLWTAHYTGKAHVCGPNEGSSTFADGTQYDDKALGRNLDVSLLKSDFFGAVPAPVNTWQPGDEHNWCAEWDRIAGKKELRYHLRRLFLRTQMLNRRRKITSAAKKTGWKDLNRLYRYAQLQKRTG